MALNFSKQQPVQDPSVERAALGRAEPTPSAAQRMSQADGLVVTRMTEAIEALLGDRACDAWGSDSIDREDLKRQGFTDSEVTTFWDTAVMAAIARRSVREVVA